MNVITKERETGSAVNDKTNTTHDVWRKANTELSFINTRVIVHLGNKIGEKIYPAKLTGKVSYCIVFTCRSIGGKLQLSAFSLIKAFFFHIYLHACRETLV